jgi:microcystin-dependent protein
MALFSGGTEMINAGTLLVGGIPTATIVPWSKSSVPSGFLECNGAAVSRSTYSDLFSAIGTTYGAGDGSSTFTLPDLQDNVAIGKSGTKALASTGGANTVASSGSVSGTVGDTALTTAQLPSHTHNPVSVTINKNIGSQVGENQAGQTGIPSVRISNNASSPLTGTGTAANAGSGDTHTHSLSANFSGSANSVVQPYLALIYIIKT